MEILKKLGWSIAKAIGSLILCCLAMLAGAFIVYCMMEYPIPAFCICGFLIFVELVRMFYKGEL